MKCPRCGANLEVVTSFYCPECGADLPFDRDDNVGRVNAYATVGFVTSCIGLFVNLFGIVPLIALLLSVKGLRQIKETGEEGKALAVCGIIISIIGLLILLLLIAVFTIYWGEFSRMILYSL